MCVAQIVKVRTSQIITIHSVHTRVDPGSLLNKQDSPDGWIWTICYMVRRRFCL